MTRKMTMTTRTRRRYTKAEKATLVIAAELSSVAAAAEANGVPESSIRVWYDDPRYAEVRAKTREEAAAGFSILIHMTQQRLQELVPTMEPRDLTILLGVAAEKAQLLGGGATSRTETRTLTDELDDHETAILRELLHSAIEEAAAVPVDGDPG